MSLPRYHNVNRPEGLGLRLAELFDELDRLRKIQPIVYQNILHVIEQYDIIKDISIIYPEIMTVDVGRMDFMSVALPPLTERASLFFVNQSFGKV